MDARGPVGTAPIQTFVQFFAAGSRAPSGSLGLRPMLPESFASGARARQRDRIIRSAYGIAPIFEPASRSFSRAEENLGAMLLPIHCVVFLAWAKDDFVIPVEAGHSLLGAVSPITFHKSLPQGMLLF
jgi:hypothetical protein